MVGNEIQFLRGDAFRRMAPPILRLEITRLGSLIDAVQEDLDLRNALVEVRFNLTTFVDLLDHAEDDTLKDTCADRLGAALCMLSMVREEVDGEAAAVLTYIMERVRYLYERSALLY